MAKPDDIYIHEVLFEFNRIGNAVRVSAIDPRRNLEVTTVAAPGTSEAVMKRVALRKLRYVIAKRAGAARRAAEAADGDETDGGWWA